MQIEIGRYFPSLGDYTRCRSGFQIQLPPAGADFYEGTATYSGQRVTSAGKVVVDCTVAIAGSDSAPLYPFHKPDDGIGTGDSTVQFSFDVDPTVRPQVPVLVRVKKRDAQSITLQVSEIHKKPVSTNLE